MRLYVLLKQNALQAKVRPPEENDLKLSDYIFTVFTYPEIFVNAEEELRRSYKLVQHCNGVTSLK